MKPVRMKPGLYAKCTRPEIEVCTEKGWPWLWVYERGHGVYAALEGRAKLRRLRDEITKVLRRKP